MKQLTAAVLASILFCACDTQPQSNSMALELSDTKIIKITYDTPHPIRADNARIIGMDEMLDRVKSIDYIKLDSSEPVGVINKMIVTKDKIFILDAYVAQQIFVWASCYTVSKIKAGGRKNIRASEICRSTPSGMKYL